MNFWSELKSLVRRSTNKQSKQQRIIKLYKKLNQKSKRRRSKRKIVIDESTIIYLFFTFGFLADICEKSWSLAHLCVEILERRERGVSWNCLYVIVVWCGNEGIEMLWVLFIWVVATNVECAWVMMSCDWFWGWHAYFLPFDWFDLRSFAKFFYASMSAKS